MGPKRRTYIVLSCHGPPVKEPEAATPTAYWSPKSECCAIDGKRGPDVVCVSCEPGT